ncbi:MAG: hypothetical protein LBK76_05550 [Verrucomicrobiales bacterium]|jgi:hypothetical protein|nr:hypothetical protein [Verrucomicrobiales bacterium]
MDIDRIFHTLNRHEVDWLLVGGMNFLLRHQPALTFDTDIWVRDEDENLRRLNLALRELGAEWGAIESAWQPVPEPHDWLKQQSVYCLTTTAGALDVFRAIKGLEGRYDACRAAADTRATADGERYLSLSDADMLACQLALPAAARKLDRVRYLQNILHTERHA